MLLNREVKLKKIDKLTSQYIESELEKLGYKVLRWSITNADNKYYTINIAVNA